MVTALSRGLGVSEASVRRDLSLLEEQQWLSRTHGGAVARSLPAGLSLVGEPAERGAEGLRIAALAVEHVQDGARVGLAAGALAVPIARRLAERERLTVVTNQLDVAYELSLRPGTTVIVPGGVASPGTPVLTGPIAERTLRELHLDLVFLGGDGVTAETGLTTEDVQVAHTARLLKDAARRAIAVFDTPQIGRVSFARICALAEVDELLTTDDLARDTRRRMEEAGVRVVTG